MNDALSLGALVPKSALHSPSSGWNGEFEMGIDAIGGRSIDGQSLRLYIWENTKLAPRLRHLPIHISPYRPSLRRGVTAVSPEEKLRSGPKAFAHRLVALALLDETELRYAGLAARPRLSRAATIDGQHGHRSENRSQSPGRKRAHSLLTYSVLPVAPRRCRRSA
jgi:hypothetical protein